MTPLYLGSRDAQIFATVHVPEYNETARAGVLLCNPFGQEAIRTHRFFRVLSERLTRVGIAVMRFEYFGTGDSAGSDEQADLERWSVDALLSCEEFKRLTGVKNIRWLGTRIGACVALNAIRQGNLLPESVTLWDPVIDGVAYLEELRLEHEKRLRQVFRRPDYPWRDWQVTSPGDTLCEAGGYPLSIRMVEQMRAIRLGEDLLPSHCPLTVIYDPASLSLRPWVSGISLNPSVRIVNLPATFSWTEYQAQNGIVVPGQALKCLLDVLGA